MDAHNELNYIAGGVSAAAGFEAVGVEASIRYRDRPDLGLLRATRRATAAAVFTRNRFCAAPVRVSRDHLEKSGGHAHAIVVNAGIANAATGEQGLRNAEEMATHTARQLGVPPEDVLVASTGVIGNPLPMDAVRRGIAASVEAIGGADPATFPQAIMTTDTVPKEYAVAFDVNGQSVRIGGCCKGAGMIAPNMATMLAFLTTDAAVEPAFLQQMLRRAVARTFNRMSVDGDQSTNDTVFLLASGCSGAIESHTAGADRFEAALETVCRELAKKIARDGEGATRLVEIHVRGAMDEADAERAARAIGNSNLVKTAIYGNDANWGRIVCALGYSGARFAPEQVHVWIEGLQIVRNGARAEYDEADATARMSRDPFHITVDLQNGDADATFWTCDLTEGYIEENAAYRS